MRSSVQHWLSPANLQDHLHRHYLEYMSETSDWFSEAPHAQAFLYNWVAVRTQGRAGTGKTAFAAFLVDHQVKQNECVLYFFCKPGNNERREATHIHPKLLPQLLHYDESLYSGNAAFYNRKGRAKAHSHVDSCAAFVLHVRSFFRNVL